jgi:hypothetical protein
MASGSISSSASTFLGFRPNPNNPIPNSSFYYPETSFLEGDVGKLVVGSGLTINYSAGTINASGGGGGGAVNQVTGGTGISVSPTTGNVVVNNTGVLQVTAGTGISISGTKTNYTINATTLGTVTSVTAGSGLTGGVITSAGTLAVDGNIVLLKNLYTAKGQILVSTGASTVTPFASSGFPNGYLLTLDSTTATGMKWAPAAPAVQSVAGLAPIQVTAGVNPVVSIDTATTANSGATTLVNDVVTNDPTKALTAAQGFALQQQINALTGAGGLTLAGTINASTGNMVTVTANGAGAGFAVGSPLPAAASGNQDYFAIVTVAGSFTPPGGSLTVATQGDWFNSTGLAWDFLNVGFDAPAATTSVAGIVCLATSGEAILGTDTTKALTPAAAKAAYIPTACLTNKGTLVSASTATNPIALAVGSDGQQLVACSAATSGLCWQTPPLPAIPCACITGKGVVLSGTAANNPAALSAGLDGQYLQANSAAATGLCWATPPYIPCACITGKGALITGPSAGNPVALPVGTDGQVLSANSGAANGLSWCTPAYIPCSIVTAQGGVIGGSAVGTPVYQGPAPANGCLLSSCSTCASGLAWVAPPPQATPSTFGLVKGCTAASFTSLGCTTGILVTGTNSTYLGSNILYVGLPITSGCDTFVGSCIGGNPGGYRTGSCNTVVGACALYYMGDNTRGNTAIGAGIHNCAGNTLTGSNNLILASGSGINAPSNTGSCQLAIGFSTAGLPQVSCYWLTGCSNKTIRPGAGILDCDGNPGLPSGGGNFQILTSQGVNGVTWCSLPSPSNIQRGVFYGFDTGGTALGFNAGAVAFGGGVAACSLNAVAVGPSAGYLATDISNSVLIGGGAGCSGQAFGITNTVAIGCGSVSESAPAISLNLGTFVGFRAGVCVEGWCNTFIGAQAGENFAAGTNNTALGYGATPAGGASNTVTLGNNLITTLRAAVTSITSLSDARDKTNVNTLPVGIDFIKDLNPVTFQWQYREGNPVKDGSVDSGFIAQQLHEVQNKYNAGYLGLVNTDDPWRYEATPGKLIPVLVKALQDLTAAHERLREDFDSYRANHR